MAELLRRLHRIVALLFLLTIPPAAYFSFTGNPASPSPVVYLPLLPLFVLMITGTYMLVRPWVQRWKARPSSKGPGDGKENIA